ncbi:alkaline phosphatase-like protein [Zopfia rhizophila CBS 207.26]|uniref:Alkaline phosphatase-like protein n=1 Tax=Zopfia rhizophila CBS 207.26 TaxID=1314779 RepID=A0A6A6EPF7_9PEZI|nr:alkaline phosphatase-like protein [Zopfia rhizophila CBS 207.26]
MSTNKRPNFLIIVADDLGFSDTGPYGSEISTPALDRLARDDLRMTDFYTAPACSPTRAILLSGTDNRPGYEGYLNFQVATVSEIFQDAGYFTMMLIGRQTDLPKDFYSSDYFTDRPIQFLNNRNKTEEERPYFAYLVYTAPHWPLRVPRETIAKYRGKYDDGPEELRLHRLSRLQNLGLVPKDIVPVPLVSSSSNFPEWQAMTSIEHAESARKMEVYAAMVDPMDANIGHVLGRLEATGDLDNTFVVFRSDNGAERSLMEALPMIGSLTINEMVKRYYDNSLDNIGNGNSYVWYGPRWAHAATVPSRGFKGWTTEGGIRCPCIVRYPPLKRSSGNTISHEFTTVMDILPTCLELAGLSHPGNKGFRGREVVSPRGKLWVSYLSSQSTSVYDAQLDVTDYKAVWIPPSKGKGQWELYILVKDPGELDDLAQIKKGALNGLLEEWERYFAKTGMFE